MMMATILLSSMHGLVRYLAEDMHPFVVAFYRNIFGLITALPLILKIGISGLRMKRPGLMFLRSVIGIFAMLLWFYGLSRVPTTEATALSFSAAIFAAISAVVVLGEKINLRRTVAIVGGLIGVMVVLQPSSDSFNPYMWLIIIACVFWGLSMTTVKILTRTESTISIVVWMSLYLVVFSLPPALMYWQWPDWEHLFLLALMGAFATLGHLCMTRAVSLADITSVMSIDFMRLIWAALIGVFFFKDAFYLHTWIGALIIFVTGLYIIFRESKVKTKRKI